MGVFRKSLSLSVTLCLVLSSVPMTAFADSSTSIPADAKKSPYSPKDTSFCDYKAPDLLRKLNDANSAKLTRLEELRQEIVGVTSEMEILNTMGAFRDSYLQSLSAIKTGSSEKLNNLGNMKKVIRNGLMLNVVGLLLKNGNLDKDDAFKVSAICEIPENKLQPICSQKGMFSPFLKVHPLDQTLANFKQAYKNVSATKAPVLKEDIQKILSSIPDNISPEVIFSLLNSSAPKLTDIIISAKTQESLRKCLEEKSSIEVLKSCEELLPAIGSEKADENFVVQLNKKTNDAVSAISGLSGIIRDAAKTNLDNLNKEIKKHSDLIQTSMNVEGPKLKQAFDDASSKLEQSGIQQSKIAQQQLNTGGTSKDQSPSDLSQQRTTLQTKMSLNNLGIARLFLNEKDLTGSSTPREVADKQKMQMDAAIKSREIWGQRCAPAKTEEDIKYCDKQMVIVNSNIRNETNNYKDRLQSLQNEISKISVNDKFQQIEVHKKFIAEKYLRTCKNNSAITIKDESLKFGISVDNHCYGGLPQTLVSINSLGNDLNSIFADTKFSKLIKAKSSGETTFNDDEMNEFKTACKNNPGPESSDVCSMIERENVAYVATTNQIKKKKQAEKEVSEDENNWVQYNGNGGYTKIPKKSALRVFGEGVLPVAPTLIPMFFANFQTTQNINMLTNQALYQKQMLHTYDVYNSSPWMYNYNYFGGPAYGYGSPFSTTGTPTSTTGITSSTGFGF